MTKALLGLGFVLVVALAMVAGAGVHTWLDDATETAESQHTDDPLLTTAQVRLLVRTFLMSEIGESTYAVRKICYGEKWGQPLIGSTPFLPDFTFEYVGDKLWLASNKRCSIRVSDATGKVSAP